MHALNQQSLLTPPSESSPEILSTAQTVLRAQARGLAYIADTYDKDPAVQNQFFLSLQYMHNAILSYGKIIITGMGKSYKIADKLVATMNSLGIHASTLHPSDALHGDLGVIKPTDVLVMITASGNTPELLNMLPHVPAGIPTLCLTNTMDSPLAKKSTAVLPAVVPPNLSEKAVYGLPAPTTTTTACLAVGDAVCITLAEMLTSDLNQRKANFGKWHPGGAIGQAYQADAASTGDAEAAAKHDAAKALEYVQSRISAWSDIPQLVSGYAGFETEVSAWRTCAAYPYVLLDNGRYLVSTSRISEVLARSLSSSSASASASGDWATTVRALEKGVPRQDVTLLRRCMVTDLHLLAQDTSVSVAVVLNEQGDRIGLFSR